MRVGGRVKVWASVACVVVVLLGAGAVAWHTLTWPGGRELRIERGWAYGWYGSMDVGEVFTDGWIRVRVTDHARGPLTLVSARPLMDDGGTLEVLGVKARVLPDMLPEGITGRGFQMSEDFPPTRYHAGGGVPVEGLQVRTPAWEGQDVAIEIQVGYEVVDEGITNREGVELIYDYQGRRRKAIIPSHLTICSPSTLECEPDPP